MTYERSGAFISSCGRYRYSLWRIWDQSKRTVLWIMLNPSTADGATDDPTIRRCCGYARDWGYGGIRVVNLYAFRTSSPAELWEARKRGVDIVGPDNDTQLEHAFVRGDSGIVIAGWGANVRAASRATAVCEMARREGRQLHYLAKTQSGEPRHPLYLRSELQPQAYER